MKCNMDTDCGDNSICKSKLKIIDFGSNFVQNIESFHTGLVGLCYVFGENSRTSSGESASSQRPVHVIVMSTIVMSFLNFLL